MPAEARVDDAAGSPMSSTLGAAALALARRGFAVFPLVPREKMPLKGGRGCLDATRDEDLIRRWWGNEPRSNIGLATGAPSGVFAIDIDPRHGGDHAFAALVAKSGPLPKTVTSITGSGGRHILFRHVAGIRNSAGTRLGEGVDVRGDGGFIVAAPSIHPCGRPYAWDVDCHPGETPIADAPGWLIEKVITPPERMTFAVGAAARCEGLTNYGEAALRSAAENILNARNGEQEATLNRESFGIGRLAGAGGVPPALALRVLIAAGVGMASHDPRRPWHPTDVHKKVRRAFADGLAKPRSTIEECEAEADRAARVFDG